MTQLIWFRADLRIHDHPALSAASVAEGETLAIFIATPETWMAHDDAAVKIDFIYSSLAKLQAKLAEYRIPLFVIEGSTYQDAVPLLLQFCEQHRVRGLYFNEQYEIDEQRRDESVTTLLQTKGITVHRFHDQVLVMPGMILTAKAEPFKVFTPFKNRWLDFVKNQADLREVPLPKLQNTTTTFSPKQLPNLVNDLWPAGEEEALQRLDRFLQEGLAEYHRARDFPALSGTSGLSPYLAQGLVSIRRVFQQLQACPDSPGKAAWLNELIWREFYKHVLVLFPQVSQHQPFDSHSKAKVWNHAPQLLKAWQEGQTGFPIIDAAMRQLNQTAWMHNRLRMNVAMFLVKLMNVDWRLGERYFMQHLIDGDLAANNGGWQWAAGTGCDAAPYFRIFNPTTQSEKFDPKGEFIRRYCPELAEFDDFAIHAPWERNPLLAKQVNYPLPLFNYKEARAEAIARSKRH